MRVVLDTNTLLVIIGRNSMYRPIFDAFLRSRYTLLISSEIVNEYVEKLQVHTSVVVAENIAALLLRSPDVEKVGIHFKWNLIYQDADDNKFVDCALNGGADFIVTDDRHYNALKLVGFPEMNILKTEKFLEMLVSGQ